MISKRIQRQLIASSGPLLTDFNLGIIYGTSAVLIAELEKPGSPIAITLEEGSWIASTAVLPMGVGCVLSSYIMDAHGRRFTLLLSCAANALGSLCISAAAAVWTICAGRFLTGISVGLASPPSSVYISETIDPRYRGVILAVGWLIFSFGILIAHAAGTFFSFRLTAACAAALPTISYSLIYFSPESPSWLLSKGFTVEAEQALNWLKGDSDSKSELETMVENDKKGVEKSSEKREWRKLILCRNFMRPFLILLVFFTQKQCSAVNLVSFYSVSVLKKVSPEINEYMATIAIDAMRIIMSGATCLLLEVTGKRTLALTSCLGTGLSLLGLALLLRSPQGAWLSFGPAILMISHAAFVNVGLVQLPNMMSGELFPSATRALGSGVCTCFGFFVFFIVVKTGPLLLVSMGTPATFGLYGSLTLVGFFFVYFFLPETNRKSLQQIEKELKKTGLVEVRKESKMEGRAENLSELEEDDNR